MPRQAYAIGVAGLIAAGASAPEDHHPALRIHRQVGAKFIGKADKLRETAHIEDDEDGIRDEDADYWRDLLGSSITSAPTAHSSLSPTASPTASPADKPTDAPAPAPTKAPAPTAPPAGKPTDAPAPAPTKAPTPAPTGKPTDAPAPAPTDAPVPAPTRAPTPAPTGKPTEAPIPATPMPTTPRSTPSPTDVPTISPTLTPTRTPTGAPTASPTAAPVTPAPTFQCGVSPEERATQITAQMLQVSTPADLADPTSPQTLALNWLIDEDTYYVCPDDPKLTQRYVMAVFYYSTEGDSWKECSAPKDFNDPKSIEKANEDCDVEIEIGEGGTDAWLTPVTECAWGGVACNYDVKPNHGCTERIEFEKNTMAGTIPFEMQELTYLKFFHAEEGAIGGTIPTELGNLSKLLELDLNFNKIEGPIPEELYSLTELLELDLNDNKLTGTISTQIGQLSLLTFLQLHRNEMTGTIPTEVGELDRLIVATFDTNKLTDPMPDEVCLLRAGNLRTLTSDCLDPQGPFYVECPSPCCTQCF